MGQAGVPKHSASSARLVRAFPIRPCVEVVRAINFSVVTHDGKSTSLTGEFFADSERGSAMFEVVLAGEQVERLASVKEEGGEAMSTPWTAPQSSKMSYTGTCFVSCLASIRNCMVVSSTADTMASQGTAAASESGSYAKESLKEEIRVFVPGVWLTDIRDQDPVFCRKSSEGCNCNASAEPRLLTSVTLADFSGSLRVTVQEAEFCVLVRKSTLLDVQNAIQDTGISSLTFQTRCDVILGANKYVSSGDWNHVQFEVGLYNNPVLLSLVLTCPCSSNENRCCARKSTCWHS